MTADDLRALSRFTLVDDTNYLIIPAATADALADLIDAVWTLMDWADNHIDAVIDALAALDQEPPT